tara:strand:+ start:2097 stop:2588 length:492 start_codon:yes stop_codon:yes gene_type:complete
MKKIFILFTLTILVLMASIQIGNTNEKQLDCLVEAIYFEARSENFIGQLAVANVILNRVKSKKFPNKICDVVHQGYYYKGNPVRHKCMFSYWCDGKPEKFKDTKAYLTARNVAQLSLYQVFVYNMMEATHYHANYVSPTWSKDKKFKRLLQLGKHIFYQRIGG